MLKKLKVLYLLLKTLKNIYVCDVCCLFSNLEYSWRSKTLDLVESFRMIAFSHENDTLSFELWRFKVWFFVQTINKGICLTSFSYSSNPQYFRPSKTLDLVQSFRISVDSLEDVLWASSYEGFKFWFFAKLKNNISLTMFWPFSNLLVFQTF